MKLFRIVLGRWGSQRLRHLGASSVKDVEKNAWVGSPVGSSASSFFAVASRPE
jgi:hypothetical protein